MGETSRSFAIHATEHKRDLARDEGTNAFVQHRRAVGHLPRWIDAQVVAKGLPRQKRRMFESALIADASPQVLNVMAASHRLSKVVSAIIVA